MPCGTRAAAPAALAEQLRKKTHGRFPSHETDPPVGQDRPSMLSLATLDARLTSVTCRQFPSHGARPTRRPPATLLTISLR
ncbi:hypothetical protein FM076_04205 [Streptomyces albus subsp. chlorinus]|nr:hypothetical protein [Streptomyces albus subsp. chlorinus]